MNYKIITTEQQEELVKMEQFVNRHDNGHFLQSPHWREVKDNWLWRGIAACDKGEIVGTIAVLIRKLPLGMSIFYAPRGPVCDRCDRELVQILLNGVQELAGVYHAIHLYIDPDEHDDNSEFRQMMYELGFTEKSDNGFGNIQPQFVFRLNIAGKSEDAIFNGFSEKTRYNIRLAKRHGVCVKRFYGSEAVPKWAVAVFSELMNETGRRDRFRIRGADYFEKLLRAFGEDSVLLLAELDGQFIAGAIAVYYGNKAWYLYGASSNEHRNAMPNYLLQWEMICHAVSKSCSIYDFRGISGNLSKDDPLYGLYRFKKGFGGEFTKFTGLFIYTFRPLASSVFLELVEIRRKLGDLLLK